MWLSTFKAVSAKLFGCNQRGIGGSLTSDVGYASERRPFSSLTTNNTTAVTKSTWLNAPNVYVATHHAAITDACLCV